MPCVPGRASPPTPWQPANGGELCSFLSSENDDIIAGIFRSSCWRNVSLAHLAGSSMRRSSPSRLHLGLNAQQVHVLLRRNGFLLELPAGVLQSVGWHPSTALPAGLLEAANELLGKRLHKQASVNPTEDRRWPCRQRQCLTSGASKEWSIESAGMSNSGGRVVISSRQDVSGSHDDFDAAWLGSRAGGGRVEVSTCKFPAASEAATRWFLVLGLARTLAPSGCLRKTFTSMPRGGRGLGTPGWHLQQAY